MAEGALLPVEEALSRILGAALPLPPETVDLLAASGRFLAADMAALLTQPPGDMSAMDGYALRFQDLRLSLRLIGESAAGRGFSGQLQAGETVRIFTGAPLPQGADTVAVQEDAEAQGESVRIVGDGPAAKGAHIRRAGLDFRTGEGVAKAGERLTPGRIGLLAAAGYATVPVVRRPRVALIVTGDELVPPGTLPAADRIVSSNGVMLAALLGQAGAMVQDFGIVPDRRAALADAFAAAAAHDVIITIGGASVGDHDLVRPVLLESGAEIDFWRIALRPGKPMLAGRLGNAQVIGLPGNPVSAFVCATLFVLPLLRHLSGDPRPVAEPVWAQSTVALKANGARRDFMRARLHRADDGSLWATPASAQDSSMLHVLAQADALLVRPEYAAALAVGDNVPVLTL